MVHLHMAEPSIPHYIEILDIRRDEVVFTGQGWEYPIRRAARSAWDTWKRQWSVPEGAGQFLLQWYVGPELLDAFEVTTAAFRTLTGSSPKPHAAYAAENRAFWAGLSVLATGQSG